MTTVHMQMAVLMLLAAAAVTATASDAAAAETSPTASSTTDSNERASGNKYTSAELLPVAESFEERSVMWNVSCADDHYEPRVPMCHTHACARLLVDEFVTNDDVNVLREIARRGMEGAAATGGPTILDINSGFMRGPDGFSRIYPGVKFTQQEYETYESVFTRIRDRIKRLFGITKLWFTAPTFTTRLVGNPEWSAAEMHDEYWTIHVDKNNTEHYDYSGLLYLSTYGEDFEGGKFVFYDADSNHTIEPRRGRLSVFSSGRENVHQVQKVTSGERLTLSMWYTCDQRREFDTFLDGEFHNTFKRAGGPKAKRRRPRSGSQGTKPAVKKKKKKRRRVRTEL